MKMEDERNHGIGGVGFHVGVVPVGSGSVLGITGAPVGLATGAGAAVDQHEYLQAGVMGVVYDGVVVAEHGGIPIGMSAHQGSFHAHPTDFALGKLVGHAAGEINLGRGVIHRPADIRSIRAGRRGRQDAGA